MWLQRIVTHPFIEAVMNTSEIQIPTDLVPMSFSLARIVKEEQFRLLSCSITSPDTNRTTAIQLVVNVAKTGMLSSDKYGDVTLLSEAVSCGWSFAKKAVSYTHLRAHETLR